MRNFDIRGFHIKREKARVAVDTFTDQYTTTARIPKRSNLVNSLVDNGHFAHLELGGSGGEIKNGALIFINPVEV